MGGWGGGAGKIAPESMRGDPGHLVSQIKPFGRVAGMDGSHCFFPRFFLYPAGPRKDEQPPLPGVVFGIPREQILPWGESTETDQIVRL